MGVMDPHGELPSKAVLTQEIDRLEGVIANALSLADNTDGAHHKQWTIDQMVRVLTGEDYEKWVKSYQTCGLKDCMRHEDGDDEWTEDCDQGYAWDEGIAP